MEVPLIKVGDRVKCLCGCGNNGTIIEPLDLDLTDENDHWWVKFPNRASKDSKGNIVKLSPLEQLL